MYAYLKTVRDILNSSISRKKQIVTLYLNSFIPKQVSYYLLPNVLIFDKFSFLGYYAETSVKFLQSFETSQTDLTSSVKLKLIDPLWRIQN
jgi:hypothetical protein